MFVRWGVSLGVVLLVFGGERLQQLLVDANQRVAQIGVPWRWVVLHEAANLTWYRLSTLVLDQAPITMAHYSTWIGLWYAMMFLAVISWCIAVFYPRRFTIGFRTAARVILPAALVATAGLAAGMWSQTFWQPFASSTFWTVEQLLQFSYPNLIVRPEDLVIGTASFSVQIAPSCSGYEGMGLVLVFSTAFLWYVRQELRFPQSLLLVVFGAIGAWSANVVRIVALVAIGTSWSEGVAAGGFHSQAGWLMFNGVALTIVIVARRCPFFASNAPPSAMAATTDSAYPAAPYLLPLLVSIGAAMVTAAMTRSDFDYFYPARVGAVGCILAAYWRIYRRRQILDVSLSWQAVGLGVVVFAIWMLLEPLRATREVSGETQTTALAGLSTATHVGWVLARSIGSIVVAPIVEELAFRGFLLRRLIREDFESIPLGTFSWFSFAIASLLFGMLHGRWMAGTVAGMFFSVALYQRGRLIDAVLCHATANTCITGYVLATRSWESWS